MRRSRTLNARAALLLTLPCLAVPAGTAGLCQAGGGSGTGTMAKQSERTDGQVCGHWVDQSTFLPQDPDPGLPASASAHAPPVQGLTDLGPGGLSAFLFCGALSIPSYSDHLQGPSELQLGDTHLTAWGEGCSGEAGSGWFRDLSRPSSPRGPGPRSLRPRSTGLRIPGPRSVRQRSTGLRSPGPRVLDSGVSDLGALDLGFLDPGAG